MKLNSFHKVAAAVAILAFAASPSTVDAGSASGTAGATIEKALTVTQSILMNFGRVEAPATGSGTVVLDTSDGTTDTSVTRLSGGTAASGAFTLAGSTSAAYTVSAIADTTISDGTTTLGVTAFNTSPSSGSLDGSGAGSIAVGATLTVPSTATNGTYTGTYAMTVNYN